MKDAPRQAALLLTGIQVSRNETLPAYAGGMIVYERNLWEPGEVYFFRSSSGTTPICQLARKGEGWEVLFYRGPAKLGPYPYRSFDKAKAHLMAYLRPREDALMGDPAPWIAPGNLSHLTQPVRAHALSTRHPRRARRRGAHL